MLVMGGEVQQAEQGIGGGTRCEQGIPLVLLYSYCIRDEPYKN